MVAPVGFWNEGVITTIFAPAFSAERRSSKSTPAGRHANTDQLRAGFEEDVSQARIDRLLHRDLVARADQRTAQQIHRLLAAVGDQNIVEGRAKPSCAPRSSR